jgi:hypothetical protein
MALYLRAPESFMTLEVEDFLPQLLLKLDQRRREAFDGDHISLLIGVSRDIVVHHVPREIGGDNQRCLRTRPIE